MAISVLVVDDVEDIRLMLAVALGRDPEVEMIGEAHDGASAIATATELQPDVVILDLMMPGISGLDAIPEIHGGSRASRIVAFSGQPIEMGLEALSRCADAYIEKGTPAKRIVELVKAVHEAPPKTLGVQLFRP